MKYPKQDRGYFINLIQNKMDGVHYACSNGRTFELSNVGDYYVPMGVVRRSVPGQNISRHLKTIRQLDMRPDDILICAFLKTGNHWLWEIISMLVKGSAEYILDTKGTAMLEFRSELHISNLTSPRVLNTHISVKDLPTQCIEKACKIIHLMRNPKDIAVSLFHHAKMPGCMDVEDFSSFLPFFTGESGFCLSYPWKKYEEEWDLFCKENADYPILNLYFEDMKQDPVKQIRSVAEFLEVEADIELIRKIAERCSFRNLKKANEDLKEDPYKKLSPDGKSFFYRKGEVGDWRNWFTVSDNDMFDQWLQDNTRHLSWRFQYLPISANQGQAVINNE